MSLTGARGLLLKRGSSGVVGKQPKHPAKYTDKFIPIFAELLQGCKNVLDPLSGVGKLALIQDYGYTGDVYLNELECEWAYQAQRRATITTVDAEYLPYRDAYFSAICVSPVYGNRYADHHDAKDSSRRVTYKHYLGRDLTAGNTGAMQWGPEYRQKHELIWAECYRVLQDGGIFILNISDHIRDGVVAPVTDWHIGFLTSIGLTVVEHRKIPTQRMRFGKNHKARVEHESIIVFQK